MARISRSAAATELLTRREARRHLLDYTRYTFPRFRESWHHGEIAGRLERVHRREITRLMMFAPPRHTKSELTSVRYPGYSIGNDVTRQFILATYGENLSQSFSRACRNIMQGDRYQRLWPTKFDTTGDTKWKVVRPEELENERPSFIAAGIMGSLTGEGATDFVIDDPVKNAEQAYSLVYRDKIEEQYQTTVRTRLQPNAAIVLMMTRWHEDDLAGRLLRLAAKDKLADQWHVLVLPATNPDGREAYWWDTSTGERVFFDAYDALWPEQYDQKFMIATEHSSNPMVWSALWQQAPRPAEGGIIKLAWIRYYREDDLPNKWDEVIQSWDMSFKDTKDSAYVVGQVWARWKARRYLLDQVRERMDYPTTKAAIVRMSEKWPEARRKLVEDKANGPAIIADLRDTLGGLIPVEKDKSKEACLSLASTDFQAGNVFAPDPAWQPWVVDWKDEITAAPKCVFWDQCDATAQAINDMRTHTFSHEVTVRAVPSTSSRSGGYA